MPNLCLNTLTIVGEKESIEAFYNAVAKDKKSDKINILETLYPVPAELEGKEKQWSKDKTFEQILDQQTENFTNQYDWCCAKWGSKWGDYDHNDVNYDVGDNKLYFSFTTAWCPATEGFVEVSKQFPDLIFMMTYEESGCQFCGVVAIQDGKIIADVDGEWPEYPDEDDYEDEDEWIEDCDNHSEKVDEELKKIKDEIIDEHFQDYKFKELFNDE